MLTLVGVLGVMGLGIVAVEDVGGNVGGLVRGGHCVLERGGKRDI